MMLDVRDPSTHEHLLKQRVVVLDRELDAACCKELIAKMLFLQHEDANHPIHLLVDSPGGGVAEGFAIIDAMDQISPPTFTYCYGRADAFAAIIVAHGARSHRFAAQSSQFSLSEPFVPQPTDSNTTDLLRLTSMLAETIGADTDRSVEQIRRDLASNVVFDAVAAQAYNLVDRVVPKYPECQLSV